MATTADIKNGLYIEFNDDIYTVVQFQHVKPGKGGAFVRTKLKSLTNGRVIENTFSAGHKINVTRVERRPYQFIYSDESGFTFMHIETFEQILIQPEMIENPDLMKEGQEVQAVFHADSETVLSVELPPFVALEVTYTEPGVKGDTSSGTALKPATVETGANVMVPIFINTGEKIKIDTRDRSYSERIK
jgi:elongation factor P